MGRRGLWWAVLGIALSAVGLAAPAGAAETSFDDTCGDVYGKRAVGDLDKTTDPVPGSPVTSGEQVSVTLEWPTFAVAGERAHRVMECLSVDGGAPRLWADRQFTSASGTVSLSAALPSGLAPRSTVCSQSYLKTQGSFGPVTRRSEKTCYPVGKEGTFSALARSPSPAPPAAAPSPSPDSRSTPTTRAPLFSPPATSPPSSSSRPPDEYKPPWPPWEKTPKVSPSPPPTSATTTVPQVAAPTRKSAGAQQAAPAPSSDRAPASSTLPRTGAGVLVLLGIAAVALFSGRTLRRASYVIEDNLPVPAVPVDDDDPTLILGRRW